MADGIGQALQGPTGGLVEGPPKDENDRAQRKQGWLEIFQKPEVQAMLMQFGANVQQPLAPGQTQAGHFSSAVAAGAGAAGRARQLGIAEEQQQKETELEERKVSATERQTEASSRLAETRAEQLPRQVDATTMQAEASKSQAETQSLAEQRRQEMIEFEKKNLNADTAAKIATAKTAGIRANAAKIQAENDKALIESRKDYYEAQARLHDASAARMERGEDDKGATQVYVESIADALKANYKAQGVEVTDAQAHLEAAKFASSTGGKTKQDWLAERVGELVDNSFLYDSKEQQVQLNNIYAMADGLFPESTNVTSGAGAPTGTPQPDQGGGDERFTIPEEHKQLFEETGATKQGAKLGKPISRNGKIVYQVIDKEGNVLPNLWSPDAARDALHPNQQPSNNEPSGGARGPFQRSQ